ncbi:hypothetical protein MA16_Dca007193 [Dendrobium catenatum]|uniref:Uncharacterized protein n=1 Tax=Dendrobium catenatum TaxID=906689 RepID=A0A2I0W6B2_9ASPA|nr:hypothetical protein MA16_Dca007193 [Dendrobium catenatum]
MSFLKDSIKDKKVSKPLKSFEKRTVKVSTVVVDKGKKPINIQLSNPVVQQTQKPQPFQVTLNLLENLTILLLKRDWLVHIHLKGSR